MEKKINELMTSPFDPNEGMVEGGPMGPELEKLQPKFDWISKNCFDLRPSGHVWLPQKSIGPELEELRPYLRNINIETKQWAPIDHYNLIPSPPLRGKGRIEAE